MSKKTSPENTPQNAAPPSAQQPYVVLARKYRPRTFDDLIGQDAMVRTLKNAFELGRIAQGYMLTGVRGVGKTTTARILARGLNYARPGINGPTVEMPEPGEHCQAILESRHMDVVEMDAASNTGIDDIREIIESARYMPAYARYKVFIIDEVHMLSKAAFNGLLKTLEEPPAHVKFIFATTEIRKVPVTILSRCQRFDLRRVEVDVLKAHFSRIALSEGQTIEDDALTIIARLAEGSVRDGLSLLDQAFALGGGHVTAEHVRAMAGLADSMQIYDLLHAIFRGDTAAALATTTGLYNSGADPVQILTDLASAVHVITRVKAVGAALSDISQRERERAQELAGGLSMPALARAWQMVLKGLDELSRAPRAITAAEMLVVRLCYVAQVPPPGDLARMLASQAEPSAAMSREAGAYNTQPPAGTALHFQPAFSAGAGSVASIPAPVELEAALAQEPSKPSGGAESGLTLGGFEDVVALAASKRDIKLKIALEDNVRLVRFRPGHVEIRLLPGAPDGLAQVLSRRLQEWTGERWMVSISDADGQRPIGEIRREEQARLIEEVKRHPLVKAIFKEFPEAEITRVAPLDEAKPGKTGKTGPGTP